MKRLKILVLVFLLSFMALGLFAPNSQVYAGDGDKILIKWINYSNVELSQTLGKKYEDAEGIYKLLSTSGPGGALIYRHGGEDGCTSEIKFDISNNDPPFPQPNDAKYVKLMIQDSDGNKGTCVENNVGNPKTDSKSESNSRIMLNWINSEKLQPVGMLPYYTVTRYIGGKPDNNDGKAQFRLYSDFVLNKDLSYFQEQSTLRCKSKLIKSDDNSGVFHAYKGSGSGSCDDDYNMPLNVSLGQVGNRNRPPDDNSASDPEASASFGSAGVEDDASCELSAGSALSWILCPLINGGTDIVDFVFASVIIPFLENIPISSDPSGQIYQIWSGFRILANVLLVGALLSVVISQGVGKE